MIWSSTHSGYPLGLRMVMAGILSGIVAAALVWVLADISEQAVAAGTPSPEHASNGPPVSGSGNAVVNGNNSGTVIGTQNNTIFNQTRQERRQSLSLKARANLLAQQLLDYSDERDQVGRNMGAPQNLADYVAREEVWAKDGQDRFVQMYWPRVQSIVEELTASGVDTSSISRTSATHGPRYVALRLSALAAQVGKRHPTDRTLTPLMAEAVVKGLPLPGRPEIYVQKDDANSLHVATVLQEAFIKLGYNINKKLLPIPSGRSGLKGIHVSYPYPDGEWGTSDLVYALKACELDATLEWIPYNPPYKPDGQPKEVVIKIEVWPAK